MMCAGLHCLGGSLEVVSKRLLHTSEDVSTDEGVAEFEECFVNVGAMLKANAKTTKIVQLCVSTLDHPTKFSGPLPCAVRRFAITGLMPRLRSFRRCGLES
ncbi:hypothetical protein LMG29542_08504 [Paraburkholderia humisilvae]|uniref:Uncharacterized protein n=1 Tax=Paraburkholderia humisilvae TaxID=627669 RepID=A0A6J5FBL6_9BURK|nr:hypothetical protein LMG29542_08504 [Paraburkholderia humisilvae]